MRNGEIFSMRLEQLAIDRWVVFCGWLLVIVMNDERAYESTLATGIPYGTEPMELYGDLLAGEYDEYLAGLNHLYAKVYIKYRKYGFYFDGEFYSESEERKVVNILKAKYPFTADYRNFLGLDE